METAGLDKLGAERLGYPKYGNGLFAGKSINRIYGVSFALMRTQAKYLNWVFYTLR